MDEVRGRIEQELRSVMDRLRQLGGAVVIEDLPGPVGDNNPLADPADKTQLREEREASFAIRRLLLERANRLAEALERLRGGRYMNCEECGETISPARLRALPEVTTCVRCQDRRERAARQLAQTDEAFLKAMRKRNRRVHRIKSL
jgi:DnaK suppressor protein